MKLTKFPYCNFHINNFKCNLSSGAQIKHTAQVYVFIQPFFYNYAYEDSFNTIETETAVCI